MTATDCQRLDKPITRILAAKAALETEIDRLVYELYSLTDEEIKIVERQK